MGRVSAIYSRYDLADQSNGKQPSSPRYVAVQNQLYPPGAYTLGPHNAQYQAALLAWAQSAANSTCASEPASFNEDERANS
jgi:hypothetical protein